MEEVGKAMWLVWRNLGVVPRDFWWSLSVIMCWALIWWMWLLAKAHEICVQIDLF